jgi:hypothetical protein
MSLDSIVHITIDTKSLQMAQAGFGVPLILTPENDFSTDRVRVFKDLADLKKINQKSPLYLMAKTLLAQNPRVRQAKIGLVNKGETMKTRIFMASYWLIAVVKIIKLIYQIFFHWPST